MKKWMGFLLICTGIMLARTEIYKKGLDTF